MPVEEETAAISEEEDGADRPLTRADRYRAQLESAEGELQEITDRIAAMEQEKIELEERALKLRIKIEVLEPICSELEEDEANRRGDEWQVLEAAGVQECCYRILLEEGEPMTAAGIRDSLEEHGINIKRYANPLAVIHTSLKRIPERVRSAKRKTRDVSSNASVVARFYEAIRPGAETRPKQ